MQYILNKSMAELVGVIIGDGCLRFKNSQYFIEITGNPKKEAEYYYDYLNKLVIDCTKKTPNICFRERAVRLKFYSKDFLLFLIEELNMPHSKGKNLRIKIPKQIEENDKLINSCIRGIMDTDGCLFLAKKGNNLNYPCIEITTTSPGLATQLTNILKRKGFRARLREEKRLEFANAFRIALYGKEMVEKWEKEIGFSNPKNKVIYNKYRNL